MDRKWWDKLWSDLDKRCGQSDFDWNAQKKWIERRINKLIKASSLPVTGHTIDIPMLMCAKCGARFGQGTYHDCQKK